MNEITPEQKAQLSTWAGQRDTLLSEISSLRTEKEGLEKKNKEMSSSFARMNDEMNQVIGRIDELKRKELELVTLHSEEVSLLKGTKDGLKNDIQNLLNVINKLFEEKKNIETSISQSVDTFKKIDGQAGLMDKIVDHVGRVNSHNKNEVETLLSTLKKTVNELIDVSAKNVFETNLVIEKLPQMLVEVRKQKLMRNKLI